MVGEAGEGEGESRERGEVGSSVSHTVKKHV